MTTKEQRHFYIWCGGIIIWLAIIIACIGICAWHAAVFEVEADKPAELPVVEITYTDTDEAAEAETTPVPFYPMTMDERDYFAALVAGKAVGEPAGCQQAVATVLYNDITARGGDVRKAVHDFTWCDMQTPTDDTYDAIDAVFTFGAVLLDDDVLYLGTAGHEDAFHASLEEVCTIGGITFYRER